MLWFYYHIKIENVFFFLIFCDCRENNPSSKHTTVHGIHAFQHCRRDFNEKKKKTKKKRRRIIDNKNRINDKYEFYPLIFEYKCCITHSQWVLNLAAMEIWYGNEEYPSKWHRINLRIDSIAQMLKFNSQSTASFLRQLSLLRVVELASLAWECRDAKKQKKKRTRKN